MTKRGADEQPHWQDLDLPGYMGGPSIDLGGGAISFVAATFDDADVLVASDPFVRADLISESRLKEWRVE